MSRFLHGSSRCSGAPVYTHVCMYTHMCVHMHRHMCVCIDTFVCANNRKTHEHTCPVVIFHRFAAKALALKTRREIFGFVILLIVFACRDTHVSIHTHMCLYIHTCVYTYTHVSIYTHMCLRIHTCVYTGAIFVLLMIVFACRDTHVSTHTHMCLYIHTCIYTGAIFVCMYVCMYVCM